jgi:hypothetical protein
VFGNRVLRRIFGPRRDEVTGGWGKLHSEELHNLCASPDITSDQIKAEMCGASITHWARRELHTKCWLKSLKGNEQMLCVYWCLVISSGMNISGFMNFHQSLKNY